MSTAETRRRGENRKISKMVCAGGALSEFLGFARGGGRGKRAASLSGMGESIQVNYDFYHKVTPEQLDKLLDGLKKNQ